jgi:hypothetical protein
MNKVDRPSERVNSVQNREMVNTDTKSMDDDNDEWWK